MKTTFHNLITQKEKKITEGDPFSVIPIKNAKQAFNCDEIHLGSRKIERLVNFDRFPNLEVLWINDNKVRKLLFYVNHHNKFIVIGDCWA